MAMDWDKLRVFHAVAEAGSFTHLYPEIQVGLIVDDSELDLSMREADVAIRMSPPRQPDLIQRHLVSVQVHVYASPEYIKKYGNPQRTEELDDHRIITYGEDSRPPVPGVNWLLEAGAKPGHDRRPILAVNNTYGMLRAVMSGLGIASLPDFVANEETGLVRVLPDISGPPNEAYFVYPEELRASKRISVFRDFLLRKVAEGRLS